MLLWGPAKSGKTEFCGSVGEGGLIINTGQGVQTLASPGFKVRNPSSIDIVDVAEEVDEKTGIFKTAEGFNRVCELVDWALLEPKYKTICIDDATFFTRLARNRALEINDAMGKSKSLSQSRAQGIMMMAVQDFGTEMGAIEWFLGTYIPLFKKAKKNFILTAHERHFFNKPEGIGAPRTIRKTVPAFTGEAFPDTVSAFFDLVWHFKNTGSGEGIHYRVYTKGNEEDPSGDRYSGLFNVIEENLNWPKTIERIKAGKLITKGTK